MTKIVVKSTIPRLWMEYAGPLQSYPWILVNLFKFLVHIKLVERKPMIIILVYCRIYYSQVQWIHESGTADIYFKSFVLLNIISSLTYLSSLISLSPRGELVVRGPGGVHWGHQVCFVNAGKCPPCHRLCCQVGCRMTLS